jgi:hypothetical protein
MKQLALSLLWLACSYANWGLTMGYFSHEYPDQSNIGISTFNAFGGPFALPASLTLQPRYWRVKPMTVEERWQAFHENFPHLTRAYFDAEN